MPNRPKARSLELLCGAPSQLILPTHTRQALHGIEQEPMLAMYGHDLTIAAYSAGCMAPSSREVAAAAERSGLASAASMQLEDLAGRVAQAGAPRAGALLAACPPILHRSHNIDA